MSSTVSYYTTLAGNAGITYDYDEVSYTVDSESPETPETPDPDTPEVPDLPETPDPESPDVPEVSNTPSDTEDPEVPSRPSLPNTDLIDDDLVYLPPLGEVTFVPNTGIISAVIPGLLGDDFAEVVLSQTFILVVLFVFAGSFAIYFRTRKVLAPVAASARIATKTSRFAKSTSNTVSVNNSKKSSQKSLKTTASVVKPTSQKTAKTIAKTPKKTTKPKSSKASTTAKVKKTTKASRK